MIRRVQREHWTWTADENQHPALVSMELWEAAQVIGRQRQKQFILAAEIAVKRGGCETRFRRHRAQVIHTAGLPDPVDLALPFR